MFSHLHVHTEYSLLDGLCRIPQLISRTKELGMNSLAITDHGTLHGAIAFYRAARDAGIKPIIGCEVYVAEGSRNNRGAGDKSNYHLTLLAKNEDGYRNLIQLATKANIEGFYYKPRVDKELLIQYSQGLVALSGCAHGRIPTLILAGRLQDAIDEALWHKQNLPDFYFEIQRHPIPELERINQVLLQLAGELHIPVVATSDVHYIRQEDATTHEILLCIQTNMTMLDEKRLKLAGDFFYLKSPEEMTALFSDLPEAIDNANKIADECNLQIEFNKLHFPQMPLPEKKTADEYLSELCWQGMRQRYQVPPAGAEQRLTYELDVIRQTNFAHYFLVVWDIISFVRNRKILFGVRGSAAASLALYCLAITDIDPLVHKLVFERFLNKERKEMPDIDMDFQDDRRDEVISYVTEKYGTDHVAQIITFGTLGARAALRDVGRALGMPYSHVDQVARLVPPLPGMTLDRAMKENADLGNIYHQDEAVHRLIDTAQKLEGTSRHASTHAAGVVISEEPLTRYLPLQRAGKDSQTVMTQLPMEDVAKLGLLKMDFLGLANLTILAKATQVIAADLGIDIDLQHLPLDNAKTFELLSSGETGGVFQLEGGGMRRYIKELKPTTFSDIAAMIALYRPGPMEHIPTFIRAKHGIEEARYPHPSLEKILEETYGVIVYQDQVLLIVQALAGYSLGEADIFRKAMGKKIPEVMKKQKQNFISRAINKGVTEETAHEIFTLIEPFAGYAFNKAHSVSYAFIAYQTAYLKANYPVQYITALLNSHSDEQDKISSAISECRRLGIPVLPPNINLSHPDFTIEHIAAEGTAPARGIRFGLASIKNVSRSTVEPILTARNEGGEFNSIEDLCRRADLRGINKKVLESLIQVGCFDSLAHRGALLGAVDHILSLSHQQQHLKESGQMSMFDLFGQNVPLPFPALKLEGSDLPLKEKLEFEKDLLGVYFTEHPFSSFIQGVSSTTLCGQITAEMVGSKVTVAGMVSSVRPLVTRDKRPFVMAALEDIDGTVEVAVWPDVYKRTQELWQVSNILVVDGSVKIRDEKVSISCFRVQKYTKEDQTPDGEPASNARSNPTPVPRRLTVNVPEEENEEDERELLNRIMSIFHKYPGPDKVWLTLVNDGQAVKLELKDSVDCRPDLVADLAVVLGRENMKVEEIRLSL